MSLGTYQYQFHPAILLVSLVLQVDPTVPYQQADPWILDHLQILLQKYLKFLVWSEVYEQFDVLLFKKEKDMAINSQFLKGTNLDIMRLSFEVRRMLRKSKTWFLSQTVEFQWCMTLRILFSSRTKQCQHPWRTLHKCRLSGPPQTCWIRICILTIAPENSHAH